MCSGIRLVMRDINKRINVHFFDISVGKGFFNAFVSSVVAAGTSGREAVILSIRNKKHVLKVSQKKEIDGVSLYFVSVVRERNTWQAKALSSGKISGIHLNQGIIGDPYYFFIIPDKQLMLAFTTGPSGSLKSVGRTILEQFNGDRSSEINLNLIPKEKEFDKLKELPEYSSLHFKIASSSLVDVAENAPQLIKELSEAPYIEQGMQLSLDFSFADGLDERFSKEGILEIVSFLSEHDGCAVLKVKGVDQNGLPINLDFGNAFLNYKTNVISRESFVDEELAVNILSEALGECGSSLPSY